MPDLGNSKDSLRNIVGLSGQFVGTTDPAVETGKTIRLEDNTITSTTPALGQIPVSDGTKLVPRPRGAANKVFKVNSAGTDVEYGDVQDATTTVKGISELATDGEVAANLVVQSNDGRLSNARTPTVHKNTHKFGQSDEFVKTDALACMFRYLEEAADPASDSRRVWINTNTKEIEYWDNQTVPVKQTIEVQSNKAAASGYASLDGSTKVPVAQLPAATTTTSGVVELATSGENAASVVVQGNDSRLSDSRSPLAHATSHKSGGSDPIKLDELAAPTDVTTLNATTSAHGLVPKLPGGTTDFYRADGTFATPSVGAPAAHGTTHNADGVDPINAATTLVGGIVELATSAETTAGLAVQASDTRLSDSRTPLAHASTHISSGSDPIPIATTSVRGTVELATDAENAANVVVQGNDSRLSNARTPTAHATSHKTGGSDAIKLDELAAPTDITTLNATTLLHGLVPKLPGNTTTFYRGDGAYASPDGGVPAAHASTHISSGSDPIPIATTSVRGTVELATDAENAANVVVQGNDSRLSNSRAPNGSAGGDLTGTYPNPTITTNAVADAEIAAHTTTKITITNRALIPSPIAYEDEANTFSATQTMNGSLIPAADISLTGDISPTQIVANTNDYAPTGFATASVLRISTDAARNITGLAAGTDGRIIIIHNIGAFPITLTNQDALSLVGNRFLFGANFILQPEESIELRYDATSTKWRAISKFEIIPVGTTAIQGIVELATDGESAANVVVQGNDSRLTNARTPTAHAATHLSNGSDPIAAATTTVRGTVELATSAESTAGLVVQADDTRLTDSRPPNGTAGGDLTGTYPNPTVTTNAITNTKAADMAANSVKANATASTADPADLAIGTNTVLGRVAGNIVAAQLATAQVANDAITNALLNNMAANTIKGNNTSASTDPTDIAIGTNSVLGRVAGDIVAAQIVAAQIASATITDALIASSGITTRSKLPSALAYEDEANIYTLDQTFSAGILSGGKITVTGDITPTQLIANTNDYAPTNFATAAVLRLSTDASRNITGLAAGSDGRLIIIHNIGSFDIVLTNEDALSIASNRFVFGSNHTIVPNESVILLYDATSLRWRMAAKFEVIPAATTSLAGIVELATSGENAANVVVQGNDSRLSDARTPTAHASSHLSGGSDPIAIATTTARGTVELATDGEVAASVAVQGNDSRLSNSRPPNGTATGDLTGSYPAPTIAALAVTYAKMQNVSATSRILGRVTAGAGVIEELTPTQATAMLDAATTTLKGTVELATSGENAANVVVQGNDARLSDSRAPTGTAGGDLTGTYPNPTITSNAVADAEIAAHTTTKITIANRALLPSPIAYEDEANTFTLDQTFAGVAIGAETALTGDISPTQLAANTNDYAPTGFATATVLRISGSAAWNITGLAAGSDGKVIIVHNIGAFDLTFTNQDVLSIAANRFLFSANVTLEPDKSMTLIYDATTLRWRRIHSSPDATTTTKGIVELATDRESAAGVVVQGNDTRLAAATASVAGIVELANDAEVAAGVVVQGNDSRLSNSRAPNGSATGDLTGTYPAPTVTTNAITNTKLADMVANTIKGNATAGTTDPADIAIPTNTVLGRVGSNIVAASLVDAQITADTISNASLANMAANTIKGNQTAGSANPTDIAIATNTVLGRVAGDIVAAALATGQIADAAVTHAKIQNIATARILGRITAASGVEEELTGTQATTLLDVFSSTLKGLVPASGGGTTTFLRADGTFAAPTASGAISVFQKTVTEIDVVNTITETDILNVSVPANTLGATGALRVTIVGDYLNNSGTARQVTFQVKFGASGSEVATFGEITTAVTTNSQRRPFRIEFTIFNKNATNSQGTEGFLHMGAAAVASVAGQGDFVSPSAEFINASFVGANLTADTTAAMVLKVTCTHVLAAVTISCRKTFSLVELIP